MKRVQIKDGQFYGKPISGEFQFIAQDPKDANCSRDEYVRVLRNGRSLKVHVFKDDYTIVDGPITQRDINDEDALDAHIAEQFHVMEELIEMVIAGNVSSAIISGAAGIGKSHHMIKRLATAIDNEEIDTAEFVKGKMSALCLFARLYENRNSGDVLVLDDIDIIFQDETSLNILKAVLDTGDRRTVTWGTASSWLEENGIENEFDYNGQIIFVTNLDFDRKIEQQSPIAQHLLALLSRTNYLDLGIHSNREIMIRIKQVIRSSNIIADHGLTEEQGDEMMDWLEQYQDNLRDLSLRTILKLSSFIKGNPTGWRVMARATMVKHRRQR